MTTGSLTKHNLTLKIQGADSDGYMYLHELADAHQDFLC